MLLKLLVLVGLAIYFFSAAEPGLGLMSLAALTPTVGLFLAALMVIILVIKSWYGSAAILAGLIAFNLIGNKLLEGKKDTQSVDNQPPQ